MFFVSGDCRAGAAGASLLLLRCGPLTRHLREGNRTAVPVLVHGTNAELHVVLGDVQRDRGDVADGQRRRPVRIRRPPHHHLVPRQIDFGVGVPLQRGEVGAGEIDWRIRVDLHALGRAGRGGQAPQRGRVDPGHPGDVVEIHELDQVAELRAVDHLSVLMLMVEVLPGLGEPGRRVALALEGNVVAGTQVPVAPPDQLDVHASQVERRDRLDEPAQLAGGPVILPADRLQKRDLGGGHVGGDALHEKPHGEWVGFAAVVGIAGADDVVAEHALDIVACRSHLRCHKGGAVESLLLPVHSGEDDCAGELVGGEHPGEFEDAGDARSVVVCTWGVVGEVQHIGDPGIQVPGDHVEPLGGCGPLQGRDAVGDGGRHGDSRGHRLHERLLLHGHIAVRGGCDGLHLPQYPCRGGADPVHWVGLAGRGMPGAERDQLLDGGLNTVGVDLRQQCPQIRVEAPGDRGRSEAGWCGKSRRDFPDDGVSRNGCDGRGREERTAAKALWARYVIVFHAREFRTVLLQLSTVEIFSWKFSCVTSAWPFRGAIVEHQPGVFRNCVCRTWNAGGNLLTIPEYASAGVLDLVGNEDLPLCAGADEYLTIATSGLEPSPL